MDPSGLIYGLGRTLITYVSVLTAQGHVVSINIFSKHFSMNVHYINFGKKIEKVYPKGRHITTHSNGNKILILFYLILITRHNLNESGNLAPNHHVISKFAAKPNNQTEPSDMLGSRARAFRPMRCPMVAVYWRL